MSDKRDLPSARIHADEARTHLAVLAAKARHRTRRALPFVKPFAWAALFVLGPFVFGVVGGLFAALVNC